MKTMCFTGHRPDKLPWGNDEHAPECRTFRLRLMAAVYHAVEEGYTRFLTGMAEGIDLMAAEIVLTLREAKPEIQLECALPYRKNGSARFQRILQQADTVTTVSENYHSACMRMRNRYMVDQSDMVLAVYNGSSGGTKQTIEYARTQGKKVQVLTP
ncbi:MAG: DUF1273 family protein [Clostridia bacterium]|nr:DUF1273 family protein [Clostridia bacterium]